MVQVIPEGAGPVKVAIQLVPLLLVGRMCLDLGVSR
jgi:hypothetical protein